MTPSTCSVTDCGKPVHAKGMCSAHRSRLLRRGTTEPLTIEQRFAEHIASRDDCWMWDKARQDGYGQFDGKYAHRWSYEHHVGPIPEGMQLDHLCHTRDATCPGGYACGHRRCVNPAHLEPVPCRDNLLRGQSTHAATNAAKTHCIHGHPFDGTNTYITPEGRRQCRTCRETRSRAYESRRRSL